MADVKMLLYEICIPSIGALCFLGVVLNIAVFISRFYVKSRSATLELTYSLALSDTWTSLVIAISLIWNSYLPVVLQIKHSSFCFPLTLEAFRTGGLLTGIIHLVALAFAHYLQIRRPFDHQKILSLRTVQILIFSIWAVPPLSLIIYFSSWPGEGFRNEACINNSFYNTLYFRAQISLIIIVLMITTTVLYWKMLSKVSEVRSKTASATSARGRRTVVTAALIFGTFLIGWTPASIMFLLTADGIPLLRNSGILITVLSLVVIINIMVKSLTNPIIYATRIPEIRHFVLHRLLWRIVPLREEASAREESTKKAESKPLRSSPVQPQSL
ncbi:7 transmembrane receptor [Trichostrongylus colubriformis]|uniref:7 transmembrane receptor n=1 Tax=Trichostrongylus colubriformis TaxID=6319 RepID=A0AAN8FHY6_TRICO